MATSWYYNAVTGQIFSASGAEKFALDKSIMLEKLPGVAKALYGPYGTEAEARAVAAQHPSLGSVVGSAAGAIPTPTDVTDRVLGAVGPILVRVGEVVAGVVLLAIAANVILKQTTGVDVAGSAARAAGTARRMVP